MGQAWACFSGPMVGPGLGRDFPHRALVGPARDMLSYTYNRVALESPGTETVTLRDGLKLFRCDIGCYLIYVYGP
jgi:hypothetical protein